MGRQTSQYLWGAKLVNIPSVFLWPSSLFTWSIRLFIRSIFPFLYDQLEFLCGQLLLIIRSTIFTFYMVNFLFCIWSSRLFTFYVGQCKTQSADLWRQTADRGEVQAEGKMQTEDCRPEVKCRLGFKITRFPGKTSRVSWDRGRCSELQFLRNCWRWHIALRLERLET